MSSSASGRFVLRTPSDLHRRLREEADAAGLSLNQLCVNLLDKGARGGGLALETRWPEIGDVLEVWGEHLEGVYVFGSTARGEAGASSDLDLLLVLRNGADLSRELYTQWDQAAAERGWNPQIEPHFVVLPTTETEAGSIWLETAVDGIPVWDREWKVSRFLSKLRQSIAQGRVRRRYSHGHPYWVRAQGAA